MLAIATRSDEFLGEFWWVAFDPFGISALIKDYKFSRQGCYYHHIDINEAFGGLAVKLPAFRLLSTGSNPRYYTRS